MWLVLGALTAGGPIARGGDFATSVVEYRPAPGQFVNNPTYNNPLKALGPPDGGGTFSADNSKLVTLGGFGGSITLRFVPPVMNDPRHPMGLDAIVFGNAVWVGGDPSVRFCEAGVIEISRDANGNGLADDPWYVIPGSSIPMPPGGVPKSVMRTQSWDNKSSTQVPPSNQSWYPIQVYFPGWPNSYSTSTFELPATFRTDRLSNPGGSAETRWGYGDFSPTLILGDMSGASGSGYDNSLDDPEDEPDIDPELFYTTPDNPFVVGITPGSGGGDAFDIAWAVDPANGMPANLDRFDFIRISTAVDGSFGPGGILGEISTEIGGVARVRPVILVGDFNADGIVNSSDLALLLGAWGFCAGCSADLNGDNVVGSTDLALLLGKWGAHI